MLGSSSPRSALSAVRAPFCRISARDSGEYHALWGVHLRSGYGLDVVWMWAGCVGRDGAEINDDEGGAREARGLRWARVEERAWG